MAKIISHSKELGYRTKCKTCKAVFEFSHKETTKGVGTGRLLTLCPCCGKVVYYNFFTWKKIKVDKNT